MPLLWLAQLRQPIGMRGWIKRPLRRHRTEGLTGLRRRTLTATPTKPRSRRPTVNWTWAAQQGRATPAQWVCSGQGAGCKDGGTVQCGGLTQCGPIVQTVEVIQGAPTPLGGAIAPGLYLLTSANVYRAMAGGATPILQIAYDFINTQFAESTR